MNFLLADQTVPVIQGVLDPTAPVIIGTLDPADPTIFGALVGGDAKHDLVLVNGNLSPTAGLDQRIDCALRTFIREFWLDPSVGTQYFEEFLKKSPDLQVCRQALATTIQAVPGVQRLDSLTVAFDNANRRLRVDFQVSGTDAIPVSGVSEVVA